MKLHTKVILSVVLGLAATGCTSLPGTSQGSGAPASIPQTGNCPQLDHALTLMQNADVSNSEWNTPVKDLPASLDSLRQSLINNGVNPSESIANNYSQMANGPWAKC